MRTPLSWPSTRNENTPFRFLNRLTANIGWTFMLRLPRQLGNLAWGFSSSEEKTGGEGGIRTPGALRLSGFQDRRDRPLCHLSCRAQNRRETPRLSSFLARTSPTPRRGRRL